MQPKRITEEKALSQRLELHYPNPTKLSAVEAPYREMTTDFSRPDFAATDFAVDDFNGGDFALMDYALPDGMGSRLSRLTRARVSDGPTSSGARSFYQVAKRGLDLSLAFMLLLLTSPLLLVIALLVKVSSKGPIFFAHRRLGRDGKEFHCLKFRTMIANAEERLQRDQQLRRRFEERFKLEDDPRITPVGGFLRRTSLDELPQLFHVLRGEMSLVGPRPIVKDELSKYSIYAHKLLSVKPGLSGLWQVCGRSDTTYPQRVMMDMHYIDHRCLWLDLQLLVLTASAVVRKSGAW